MSSWHPGWSTKSHCREPSWRMHTSSMMMKINGCAASVIRHCSSYIHGHACQVVAWPRGSSAHSGRSLADAWPRPLHAMQGPRGRTGPVPLAVTWVMLASSLEALTSRRFTRSLAPSSGFLWPRGSASTGLGSDVCCASWQLLQPGDGEGVRCALQRPCSLLVLWLEEILHHFLGFQFIGQAAMSPHPLFNIGR